jgi:AraC-like DNA-binding protein
MATMDAHGTLGILNPALGLTRFSLERRAPAAELEEVVERFWMVRWDLPPGESFAQEILPHPCANLSLERSTVNARGANGRGVEVPGLGTRRFVAVLAGRGVVLGTKLTPAGLSALARVPVATTVDRVFTMDEVVGASPALDVDDMPPDEAFAALCGAMSAVICERLDEAPLDPAVARVNALVARVRADRTILRADDLARADGSSLRQLQRLFRRTLGVGPKWVVRRTRVQEAAERVAGGLPVPWARVAQELGYHDQAHLIRDFRAQIGFTPEAYARRCRDAASRPARSGEVRA